MEFGFAQAPAANPKKTAPNARKPRRKPLSDAQRALIAQKRAQSRQEREKQKITLAVNAISAKYPDPYTAWDRIETELEWARIAYDRLLRAKPDSPKTRLQKEVVSRLARLSVQAEAAHSRMLTQH
jgi:hypothetical protein